MVTKLERYLGYHVSNLLGEAPFNQWRHERSVEEALDEPIIHYVFHEHGLELRCDGDDRISVIFMYSDKFGGFAESLLEIPFGWSRGEVLERFGKPSKSGSAAKHPILGPYGAWDRYPINRNAIRFEYSLNADCIRKITLMREDSVP